MNETNSPNKRALLIGVNKYPNLPDYSQLRGCVNDVELMRRTLETSFGFPPGNITVLRDEEATHNGIRRAMETIIKDCRPNDIVVFHFSGHGSQMAAAGDKPRGYDESIMPYDSGRMNNPKFPRQVPPCDIRDTDIQAWLARLTQKTPHVTLVFDSCHSGSITRMQDDSQEEGTRLRWIEPDPLPSETPTELLRANGSPTRELNAGSGWLQASDKYVLLAACAAEQGAYEMDTEFDGQPSRNGAFTFFLTREIIQATQSTYQDIWDMVAIKVNNRFQKQTPQLEGARDRQIFDVHDFAPMRYLLVTERQAAELTLAGGSIHGVTIGSRWEIYPPGAKQIPADEESSGVLEITAVTSVSARGVIIGERGSQPIVPGSRAVEAVHANQETRMPISLAPAPKGREQFVLELQRHLTESTLLTITDADANTRASISIVCPVSAQSEQQHELEPKWQVVDQSQAQLMDQYPVRDPQSSARIRENLETIWRYERVLELRNERSSLKGKVDFVLLKRINGKWLEVTDRGEPVYREGDVIAFRVINRSGDQIHISVLDLGLSKRISLLYPVASASETIASTRDAGSANEVEVSGMLSIGERPETEIELFFPESPTFPGSGANGALRGKEVFKLCITSARHDLGFLKQSGIRTEALSTLEHPLEQLIYMAAGNGLTRDARMKLEAEDEWFTIERAFWLERKPLPPK